MITEETLPFEMIQNYIERRRADLLVYDHSLKQGDLETIGTIGHKMKGNGISFGFPQLSTLGDAIEIAALNKDINELDHLLNEFRLQISTIER